MRHLIACLSDEERLVAVASVQALCRLAEPSGMMSLYELARNEVADPLVRRAAAEALVTVGLLRRPRTGPSTMSLWLLGLTLVIVSVGAASYIGAAAVALFVAGAAVLAVYALRAVRQGEGTSNVYVGPHGEEIRVPPASRRDELYGGNGAGFEWSVGGDVGGGGNGG